MSSDPHMNYNMRSVQQRTLDTLIGISKGILADGVVTQAEAESLLSWLAVNEATVVKSPVTHNLLIRVEEMLQDNVLDQDEAEELHDVLTALSGGISEFGEFSKSASFPLDEPPPPITFINKSFLFTGTCLFGKRAECHEAVIERGGKVQKNVTLSLDYLVIGYYVTPSWKHQSFGGKIEKAMQHRDTRKSDLAIVSEEHWTKETNLTAT